MNVRVAKGFVPVSARFTIHPMAQHALLTESQMVLLDATIAALGVTGHPIAWIAGTRVVMRDERLVSEPLRTLTLTLVVDVGLVGGQRNLRRGYVEWHDDHWLTWISSAAIATRFAPHLLHVGPRLAEDPWIQRRDAGVCL